MLDRLYFTDSDEANALIASDPMALLVGFALDQQITVQKAFEGPLVLKERLGGIDADTLASADLEPVFRTRPVIHRYPRSMAGRVHDLAVYLRDRYDGDAARVWTDAADADELRANIAALPGFGEMKIKALGPCSPSASASRSRASWCRGIRRSATSTRLRRSPPTRRPSASTRPSGRAGGRWPLRPERWRAPRPPAGRGQAQGGPARRGDGVPGAERLDRQPLLALWIGSRVQGQESQPSMGAFAVVIIALIVFSMGLYQLLKLTMHAYQEATGTAPTVRTHAPWLRSMRDERPDRQAAAARISGAEKVVVATVLLAAAAFEIWFFFLSGSSIGGAGSR